MLLQKEYLLGSLKFPPSSPSLDNAMPAASFSPRCLICRDALGDERYFYLRRRAYSDAFVMLFVKILPPYRSFSPAIFSTHGAMLISAERFDVTRAGGACAAHLLRGTLPAGTWLETTPAMRERHHNSYASIRYRCRRWRSLRHMRAGSLRPCAIRSFTPRRLHHQHRPCPTIDTRC